VESYWRWKEGIQGETKRINSLRWWLPSPRVGHRNFPKYFRLSKPTDMTIHWKALEEHFLMVYH
jgi:hypothetical protein